MAEKKYYWLKLPRNFFGKHYIKNTQSQGKRRIVGAFLYVDAHRSHRP